MKNNTSTVIQDLSAAQTASRSRYRPSLSLVAACVLVIATLISSVAEARPIRFDFGDWTEDPVEVADGDTLALGFPVSLFGAGAPTITFDAAGNISVGGAMIQGYASGSPLDMRYQATTAGFSVPGVLQGFRVCWGCGPSGNNDFIDQDDPPPVPIPADQSVFEIGLFDLGGGITAIELNFNALAAGATDPFIGFTDGAGTTTDLLTMFGGLQAVGSSDDCAATPTALACNSFVDAALGAPALSYFLDFDGSAVDGRYVFVIGGSEEPPPTVPEPNPMVLMLLGLMSLSLMRMRRRTIVAKRRN